MQKDSREQRFAECVEILAGLLAEERPKIKCDKMIISGGNVEIATDVECKELVAGSEGVISMNNLKTEGIAEEEDEEIKKELKELHEISEELVSTLKALAVNKGDKEVNRVVEQLLAAFKKKME